MFEWIISERSWIYCQVFFKEFSLEPIDILIWGPVLSFLLALHLFFFIFYFLNCFKLVQNSYLEVLLDSQKN